MLVGLVTMRSLADASKEAFDLNEESSKKILELLGWENKEVITKEEFKDFFIKILYKNDDNNLNNLSLGIIEKYVKDIPEKIELKDFGKWVSYDRFIEAMKETVRELFGEQYVDEVVKAFDEEEEEAIKKYEEQEKEEEEKMETVEDL